jgi:hypothetical protein
MILFNSFDKPPLFETYATLPIQLIWIIPGLYSFESIMLSIIPPVLPILKHPGFIPPTVAGPIINTFLFFANPINERLN